MVSSWKKGMVLLFKCILRGISKTHVDLCVICFISQNNILSINENLYHFLTTTASLTAAFFLRSGSLVAFSEDSLMESFQIKDEVRVHQDRYSLLYLEKPFIVPGGRFRETYYW